MRVLDLFTSWMRILVISISWSNFYHMKWRENRIFHPTDICSWLLYHEFPISDDLNTFSSLQNLIRTHNWNIAFLDYSAVILPRLKPMWPLIDTSLTVGRDTLLNIYYVPLTSFLLCYFKQKCWHEKVEERLVGNMLLWS